MSTPTLTLQERIAAAYEAASELVGKRNVSASFTVDDMTYTVKPARLGRKVHDLQSALKQRDELRDAALSVCLGVKPAEERDMSIVNNWRIKRLAEALQPLNIESALKE